MAISQTIVVNVVSPVNTTTFAAGSTISLAATASETSGTITLVSFYQGSTLLGNGALNNGVYLFNWSNVAAGSYAVTAKANDNNSHTQTSAVVNITVSSLSPSNTWVQGGNSFGVNAVLGTNDASRLLFKTNGLERMTILSNGNTGIGTSTPGTQLELTGTLKLDSLVNTPNIDNVLATDNSGNVRTRQIPYYTFDNGLTSPDGTEIVVGGDMNNGLNLNFPPSMAYTDDGSGNIIYNSPPYYGSLTYDNQNGIFNYNSQLNDSLGYAGNALNFSIANQGVQIYSFGESAQDIRAAGMFQYSGVDNGGPGLSLFAFDSSNINIDRILNGIQIYPQGMDLNTRGIQLNYFLNTPGMDSVLVTDSLGNLRQKAMSAFGSSGHWQVNDNISYDTLDANIGIGTTNPQSKLAVKGTITAEKIKITQTGWPDFVFDRAYPLPTLSEIEKYLKKNKHLPNIPSVSEVAIHGIDLGDNQAALLQKIEELTLYSIEQDKRIKSLEDKINKMLSTKN